MLTLAHSHFIPISPSLNLFILLCTLEGTFILVFRQTFIARGHGLVLVPIDFLKHRAQLKWDLDNFLITLHLRYHIIKSIVNLYLYWALACQVPLIEFEINTTFQNGLNRRRADWDYSGSLRKRGWEKCQRRWSIWQIKGYSSVRLMIESWKLIEERLSGEVLGRSVSCEFSFKDGAKKDVIAEVREDFSIHSTQTIWSS